MKRSRAPSVLAKFRNEAASASNLDIDFPPHKKTVTAVSIPKPSSTSVPVLSPGSLREQIKKENAEIIRRNMEQKENIQSSVVYYSVFLKKKFQKKHKNFEDGYVALKDDREVQLFNEAGKVIGKHQFGVPLNGLKTGNTIEIGGYEVEVNAHVDSKLFVSGRIFLNKEFSVVQGATSSKIQKTKAASLDPVPPDALVLLEEDCVPVVALDRYLGKHLRPHQKEGVQFLFNSIIGTKSNGKRCGAILADSMGLGKSLQALCLIWTALKQGPGGQPLAQKAIIVCPASLVANWTREVKKWLGNERLTPCAIYPSKEKEIKSQLHSFLTSKLRPLLIISYELLRKHAPQLYKSGCDLIVCDEGHRLKSSQGNKTVDALGAFPCKRRVILTGTPLQNDLDEFYAMCNFINPGCLGDLGTFRTVFSNPITLMKDVNASEETKTLGKTRAEELAKITGEFVLRRTSAVMEKYLPPKSEIVLFCRLTDDQWELYRQVCKNGKSQLSGSNNMGLAFSSMTKLRKICSHPTLHQVENDPESIMDSSKEDGRWTLDPSTSGKLSVLQQLLRGIVDESPENKVVLISNFTQNLDLFERMLKQMNVKYTRLDGAVASTARGHLVDRFNDVGSNIQVFLLSSKAGGMGLNLVGANRLVLFDPDWNPANDKQAMARVWRDGQKKSVFIYRFLGTGTIEEKIFQRQLFKLDLDSTIDECEVGGDSVDGVGNNNIQMDQPKFSIEELRNLFTVPDRDLICETRDVLLSEGARQFQNGKFYLPEEVKVKDVGINSVSRSGHVSCMFVCYYGEGNENRKECAQKENIDENAYSVVVGEGDKNDAEDEECQEDDLDEEDKYDEEDDMDE